MLLCILLLYAFHIMVCICPSMISKNEYICCSIEFFVETIGGPKSLNDFLTWYSFKYGYLFCKEVQKSSTCFHAWTDVGHSKKRWMSLHSPLHDGQERSASFIQCLAWDPMRIAPCINEYLRLIRLGLFVGCVFNVGQLYFFTWK